MKVKVIYDPFLRKSVQPVTVFDDELKVQAQEMLTTMRSHIGLGLAASQVGIDKQLFVMGYEPTGKDDEMPRIPSVALCNPRIVKASKEKDVLLEGCLSLPGLELPVERSVGVTVEAQNLEGKPVTLKVKGIAARIIQHEIDHLHGILFTDRATEVNNLKHYQFARVVFIGSDEYSRPAFDVLKDSLPIMAVITETAKPAGRGGQLREPVMKAAAEELGVAVFQPSDTAELTTILRQLEPDLVILASYGKILPAEALTIPVYGALNIHPSLLPKYRGATPIPSAILAGEKETGVTIITMSPQVDAGMILAQAAEPILATDTTLTLRDRLFTKGAQLLLKSLPLYLSGQATLLAQNSEKATTTKRFTKEMGEIDWSNDAAILDRQIRALNPWPGAFTFIDGKRLKLLAAHLEGDQLALDEVQLEGKQPTNWADFKRGYSNQLTKTPWFSKIV